MVQSRVTIAIALGALILASAAIVGLRTRSRTPFPRLTAPPPPADTAEAIAPAVPVARRSEDSTPPSDADRARATAAARPKPPSTSWRIQGFVATRDDEPLPGALVRLEFWGSGGPTKVGEAVSEENGAYKIDLADLESLRRAAGEIGHFVARASRLGFRGALSSRLALPDPLAAPSVLRLDVTLDPLFGISGRVLDESGAPVALATLMLRRADGTGSMREAESDELGHYGFDLASLVEGGAFEITGSEPSAGRGTVGPIEAHPERGVRAPDLVLHPHGTIEGVARFRNGAPAGAVLVIATPVGEARRETHADLGVPDAATEGDGEIAVLEDDPAGASNSGAETGPESVAVESDSAGRFRFASLEPGRHALVAEIPFDGDRARISSLLQARRRSGWTPQRPTIAETGDSGVIVPIDSYRLTIRVLDETGEPAIGATLDFRSEGSSDEWSIPSGGYRVLSDPAPQSIAVSPGDTVTLRAQRGDAGTEAILSIGESDVDTEATLTLRPLSYGSIRISVTDERGEKFEPFTVDVLMQIGSESAYRCIFRGSAGGDGLLSSIPAGRHRIVVGPPPYRAGERLFPMETHVDVFPGQESSVDFVARAASVLRVILRTEPPCRVRVGTIEAVPTRGGAATSVRLFDFDADASAILEENVVRSGVHVQARDLLEPGDYVLHVEAAGFQSTDVSFTAPPGGTVDVVVPLEPE